MTGTRVRRSQRGFTLVEVVVTIALLSVALLGLAPLASRVARLSRTSTLEAQRTAILAGAVQRVGMVSFSSLSPGTSCSDFSFADFPHTECVAVADLDPKTKRVTVIVTPANGAADSTVFDRSEGARDNPLSP
jgi:prepilin-type N-terminal cleavage/methylation domain-containing protein